jgi:hypothetical protein
MNEANMDTDRLDESTVDALGKLSEALEVVEHARGMLYAFHRLSGMADLTLGEAARDFRAIGQPAIADRIETELVGRNVIEDRWTFQIVDDYDAGYYRAFADMERETRDALAGGVKHIHEARMKEARRTHGRRHHERGDSPAGGSGIDGRNDPHGI